MKQFFSKITGVRPLADSIFSISFVAREIAGELLPGQFVNIRISDGYSPLLRRPFTVYHREGDLLQILFNAVGRGTQVLSGKKAGELLDVIGPLGNSFSLDGHFKTAILVGGGMGVASLPLLHARLRERRTRIMTFLGAKNDAALITDHLDDPYCSTDDGSRGFKGNVVSSLEKHLLGGKIEEPKIFACGPPKMLRAISELARRHALACEVSVESSMACGIGICQGCPVERAGEDGKYSLVCRDGPVFDSDTIKFVLHD